MKKYQHYLFDWGNTLMVDFPSATGPMYQWPTVEAVSGAAPLLSELSSVASCHIATNAKDSTAMEIKQAVARVHLGQYIDHIFCFQSIGVEKPSQAFFNHIFTTLEVDKHEILMIGDTLETDVLGALDFGFDAVWFNPKNQPTPAGIHSIDHLLQLIS
ncbi:HAD family hydrolase [Spartinivicinus poritis]|uniref:HAD-IA family hydrolase n=1 Tax=Spartinivicinus poritis TaxID=2994640 RepID=A0ABT5UGB7_9GAMM|nr:HAD-IA family hydrolase [Spartinivicinus sp. A2-2]MDE1465427.1 HAD-IA family hydrolase [Spartinivicinus sp. A2-2]